VVVSVGTTDHNTVDVLQHMPLVAEFALLLTTIPVVHKAVSPAVIEEPAANLRASEAAIIDQLATAIVATITAAGATLAESGNVAVLTKLPH